MHACSLRRCTLALLAVLALVRTAVATPVSVPTIPYGPNKTAVMASVGGGTPVLAEIDTGSDVLVVEQRYAGPEIRMTSSRLTLTYGGGTNPRPGTVGYARCSLLDHGRPMLTTTIEVPVLVVADGVVNKSRKGNHAILGMGMRSGVTPRLFFPSPCNAMMILDRPAGLLSFGRWTDEELTDFGMIQLTATTPVNHTLGVTPAPVAKHWNDRAVPVTATVAGRPPLALSALFDSGARTTLRLPSLAGLHHRGRTLIDGVTIWVNTSKGPLPLPATTPTFVSATAQAGLNAGNGLFMQYRVLLDQENGRIGLAPARDR